MLFDSNLGEQLLLDMLIKNLPLLLAVCFSLPSGEKSDGDFESTSGSLASAIAVARCIFAEHVLDKFIRIKGYLRRSQRSDDFFFVITTSYNAVNNCGMDVFLGHQEIGSLRDYVSIFSSQLADTCY